VGRRLIPAALLLMLGCGGDRPAPPVLRLVRETAQATRLQVDRNELSPVRLEGTLTWQVTGAGVEQAEGPVRIRAAGPFAAVAELPARAGVEYVVRVRARGAELALAMETGAADPRAVRGDRSGAETYRTADGTWEFVLRTQPVRRDPMRLHLTGRGDVELLSLEAGEAPLRLYHQRVSAEDAALVALVRRPSGQGGQRGLESLLATGESRYEWALDPAASPRVLAVETAVVPRHADRSSPPGSVQMRVELRERDGGWRTAFQLVRGGPDDDGGWRPATVPLGGATALRLATAGPGRTATVAWGLPMVRPQARSPLRRDVLHVSMEAIRPDHVGAYGARLGLTPNMDRLAAGGAVFEEARSAFGETWQSLTGMAFARFPFRIGVSGRGDGVERGHRSVADAFAEAGYLTVHVGYFLITPGQLGMVDIDEQTDSDTATMLRLEQIIAEHPHQPLYIRVHLDATHYPYDPRPPYRPAGETGPLPLAEFEQIVSAGGPPASFQRLEDLYRASMRQSDAALGKMAVRLGGADRPGGPGLIAVVADHGSHRGERGIWFLHSTLYRASLHVPFILWGPGRVLPGQRVGQLVRLIDVGPTLLDYAGVDPGGFEGISLRPLVEGRPQPGLVNLAALPLEGIVMAENDRYRLLANPSRLVGGWPRITSAKMLIPPVEVIDWRNDPQEQHNLAGGEPLLAGELWRQVTSARATVERRVTADARRLLEQAGYAEPVAR
jgi:arylsulfatase A-like enzyme